MSTCRVSFGKLPARKGKTPTTDSCSSCPFRERTIYRCAPHRFPDPIERLRVRQVSSRKNQVILPIGNTGAIFTIRAGWVARFQLLRDGSRQILSFLLPGDVVKVEAPTTTRSLFHRAMCDTVLCEFDDDSLFRYLASEPKTSMDLISQCQKEKEVLEQTIISLAKRSADERLAKLFIEIRTRLFGEREGAPLTFRTPLKRDDISDAIGLTPVHVSRILRRLRNSKIMHFKGGIIEIQDLAKLEALAALR